MRGPTESKHDTGTVSFKQIDPERFLPSAVFWIVFVKFETLWIQPRRTRHISRLFGVWWPQPIIQTERSTHKSLSTAPLKRTEHNTKRFSVTFNWHYVPPIRDAVCHWQTANRDPPCMKTAWARLFIDRCEHKWRSSSSCRLNNMSGHNIYLQRDQEWTAHNNLC